MNPFKINSASDRDVEGNISFITGEFTIGDITIDEKELPESMPILPLKDTVVFPGSTLPISVGRKKSIELIKALPKGKRYIGLVCQKDATIENPKPEEIYQIGVVAEVLRVMEFSEDNYSIIIQAKKRFQWFEMDQTEPYMSANYKIKESIKPDEDDKEFGAVLDSIRETMLSTLNTIGDPPKELVQTLSHEGFTPMLVSYCGTNMPIESAETQEILVIDDEKEQAYRLLTKLSRQLQIIEMKMDIQLKTREDLNQQQKEYFLQLQI